MKFTKTTQKKHYVTGAEMSVDELLTLLALQEIEIPLKIPNAVNPENEVGEEIWWAGFASDNIFFDGSKIIIKLEVDQEGDLPEVTK
jgi:hypothetical protein